MYGDHVVSCTARHRLMGKPIVQRHHRMVHLVHTMLRQAGRAPRMEEAYSETVIARGADSSVKVWDLTTEVKRLRPDITARGTYGGDDFIDVTIGRFRSSSQLTRAAKRREPIPVACLDVPY